MIFGLSLNDYYGVAATLYNVPAAWLVFATLDRNDIFGEIVIQWQYYDTRDQTNYYVTTSYSSPKIKAVCVDEDFRECN